MPLAHVSSSHISVFLNSLYHKLVLSRPKLLIFLLFLLSPDQPSCFLLVWWQVSLLLVSWHQERELNVFYKLVCVVSHPFEQMVKPKFSIDMYKRKIHILIKFAHNVSSVLDILAVKPSIHVLNLNQGMVMMSYFHDDKLFWNCSRIFYDL